MRTAAHNRAIKFAKNTLDAIGKDNFIIEMDDLGWRGVYEDDPVDFLSRYLASFDQNEKISEAFAIVYADLQTMVARYGYAFDSDGEVYSIIAF